MSVNGLDSPNINEAYKVALAEAGGWFLLKYISRDEVELLQRGNGGVIEIRDAISQYPEPSPLYGFIQYRRRKILLKYLPEKTSRLVQARVSVHFLAVCENFTPYDAEFTIALAAELKETALSAACSLHTASASTSSSNSSLRRRRLAEITEDNEVISQPTEPNGQSVPKESGEPRPLQEEQSTPVNTGGRAEPKERSHSQSHEDAKTPIPTSDELAAVAKMPPFERSNTAATVPLARTRDEIEYDLRPSGDRRQSSQSTRPPMSDLYESSVYGPKPKVKLGPRPSLDVDRRPRTSCSFVRQSESRPVSTLPAGIRAAPRKPVVTRPKSQNSNHAPENSIAHPPTPKLQSYTAVAPLRPVARLSNVMPPPSPTQSIHSKSGAMTTEKRRLMKALELRKKQMTKNTPQDTPEPQSASPALNLVKGDPNPSMNIKDVLENVTLKNDLTEATSYSALIVEATTGDLGQPDSSPASLTDSLEAASTPASSFSDLRVERRQKEPENVGKVFEESPALNVKDEPAPMDANPEVTAKKEPQAIDDVAEKYVELEDTRLVPNSHLPLGHDRVDEDEPSEPLPRHSTNHAEPVEQKPQTPSEPAPTVEPHVADSTEDHRARDNGILRRVSKRRGVNDLAPVDTSAEDSDENFLSDDSLMEELNLATVQEAKPIQVSKSPITPIFQVPGEHRRGDATRGSTYFRNVSNPVKQSLGYEKQGMSSRVRASEIPRSVSATHANNPDLQGVPTAVAKKVNVSSGISKRIKALEQLSSREGSPVSPPLPSSSHSNTSSSFNGLRQASLRSLNARSPSVSPQPDSAPQRVQSPSPSSPPSPERRLRSPSRSDSPQARLQFLGDVPTEKMAKSNHTTRDHQARERYFGNTANRSGFPSLHQSTSAGSAQTTERRPQVIGAQSSKTDISHMGASTSPPALLSSPSSVKSPSADGQSSSERSCSEPITPSSTQEFASSGQRSPEERKDEKKESRASRLFRRMSSMSSVSRKSLVQAISPSVKEEADPFNSEAPLSPKGRSQDLTQTPPHPRKIDVGDVNIQFPDTLLWKRRCMVIDEQGYMVLNPPRSDQSLRSVTKRYHFSDFQLPFIPDQDRQELPNSVILDFRDGSTLQCAAENPTGQAHIFKVLHESYRAWTAGDQ